ncbi:MAG: glucose-6-phosphate isomerase, partial [Gammaproteobacteria bacterium]
MLQNKGLIDRTDEWKALQRHWESLAGSHMRDMFVADPQRSERYSLSACGLELDYSKNRIDEKAMALLCDLARVADLEGWRERLFAGERINTTEQRAVLHMA